MFTLFCSSALPLHASLLKRESSWFIEIFSELCDSNPKDWLDGPKNRRERQPGICTLPAISQSGYFFPVYWFAFPTPIFPLDRGVRFGQVGKWKWRLRELDGKAIGVTQHVMWYARHRREECPPLGFLGFFSLSPSFCAANSLQPYFSSTFSLLFVCL